MNRSILRPDAAPANLVLKRWMRKDIEPAVRPRGTVEFTFAAANTEYRVRHQIPTRPGGFRVIRQDASGTIYESRKPDKFYSYLKSTAAGLKVTLEFS